MLSFTVKSYKDYTAIIIVSHGSEQGPVSPKIYFQSLIFNSYHLSCWVFHEIYKNANQTSAWRKFIFSIPLTKNSRSVNMEIRMFLKLFLIYDFPNKIHGICLTITITILIRYYDNSFLVTGVIWVFAEIFKSTIISEARFNLRISVIWKSTIVIVIMKG